MSKFSRPLKHKNAYHEKRHSLRVSLKGINCAGDHTWSSIWIPINNISSSSSSVCVYLGLMALTVLPHALRYTCPLLLGWVLRGSRSKHACEIWGVIVSIYIVIVQGETVRPRVTIIRVKDNEVDRLPAYKPGAPDYYSIQICGQNTIHTWAIWRECDAQWAVDLRGRGMRAWSWLEVWI